MIWECELRNVERTIALSLPILGIGCGEFPSLAAVAMPETPMHENHLATGRENQVRPAGQALIVEPIAKAHGMNQASHKHLRFRVL